MHIKVLILANTGWYVHNFRGSTILAFASRGIDVSVMCPENTGEDVLHELPVRVETFSLDGTGTNPLVELRSLWSIGSAIKKLQPDIVFTFNPKTNLYGLLSCRGLGIPCAPNVSGVGNASELGGWKGFLYNGLSRLAYRRAKIIFFQNTFDRDYFDKQGVLGHVPYTVLPGSGVNTERFKPSIRNRSKPFRFILACRLIRQKGVREYLLAAERISSSVGVDVEFWLAGVPDKSARAVSESEIRKYEEKGAIKFLGQVKDMSSVMSEVDCIVLPSYYPEGVPRFLLEGAAAGKVLITTDRPGCRDTVLEGENGFYVVPESVDSLVSVMEKVLSFSEEELQRMGNQSRKLAIEKFDENLVIDAYLDVARGEPRQ